MLHTHIFNTSYIHSKFTDIYHKFEQIYTRQKPVYTQIHSDTDTGGIPQLFLIVVVVVDNTLLFIE